MKRHLMLFLLLPLGCTRLAQSPSRNDVQVLSPNGAVRFHLFIENAQLKFDVRFHGEQIIEPSPLKLLLDGTDITDGVVLGKTQSYEVNETYPWRGVHSTASNHCKGATISLAHTQSGMRYTIEVRAFSDGVAFRQIIPGEEQWRVPDEATKFTVPAGSTVWHHNLEGHYEAVHKRDDAAAIEAGEWCAPPMTFKLARGGYASITEAALVNYSGMALQADGQRGFDVRLAHNHHVSYPYRLRYSNDIARVSKPATVQGTITSPWRVVMMGRDLNALVNCDIVHNLCPLPDPKLLPDGWKTDWIKPGRAVWKYLDGGANSFDAMKDFSRWAGEMGFEYHVIEGFWSRWSDEQIKELVDYSRQRGVGLWFWRHSKELRTPEAREAFFKKLHDLGVVGAKIDFFDHEHKELVDLYQALLGTAAKYHIMVNFHGANKPTGEARTWPNELTREAVRGMESSRLQARALHDTTLPFTRYLAGPGDYTPVHFGARRGDTTWAHQIATAAIFDEPLLTYGAHPTNLLKNPALPMIKSIPSVWDETIVLPNSEIGEVTAFARRKGTTWFLAILNGPTARRLDVSLSFLGAGEYKSEIVRDRPGESAAVQIENSRAAARDRVQFELNTGGGFIARFEKQ
jgi:alpha-glucosidase